MVGGRQTHSPEALNLGLRTWRATVVAKRKCPVCVVCSLHTHLSRAEFMTDTVLPRDRIRKKDIVRHLQSPQMYSCSGAPDSCTRMHPPLPGDQIDVVS